MKSFLVCSLIIIVFSVSGLAIQGATDWMVYETERAVFVYQKGVEDLVVDIVYYVEEVFDLFSLEYGTALSQEVVFVLTGCNDVGIVRTLSPFKIYVGVTQDHTAGWFSGSWLQSRLAFEIARTFTLDLILSGSRGPVRSFKEYSALNLTLPIWFLDGLAYIGLRRVIDVSTDIHAQSMLAFYLKSADPFNNESLISGFTPGGTLPRTIFGISFVDYLTSTYGNDKVLGLIHHVGSGTNMFLGINVAFQRIFEKSFQDLLEGYLDYWSGLVPASSCGVLSFPADLVEADMVQSVRIFNGRPYCSVLNTSTGVTRLVSQEDSLFSTDEEILDFSMIDGTLAVTLLEEVEGCLQGRLYIAESSQDLYLVQDRVVSAQFFGKDRLVLVVNDNGRFYLETYSLRTERRVRLHETVIPFSWVGQLTVSPSSRFVAAKLLSEDHSTLLLYDARVQQVRLYDFGHDFNLGSWFQDKLAISVIQEGRSHIGLFNPQNGNIVVSSFIHGLASWPATEQDYCYAISHMCGSLVVRTISMEAQEEFLGTPVEWFRGEDSAIEDARPYSLLGDWRSLYTVPERLGVGTVFEDLLGTTRTMLSFGLEGSLSRPFLGFDASTRRFSIVDLEISLFAAQHGSFAELSLTRDYNITRNISASWAATIQYPFKVSLALSGKLSDSALLFGGISRASATVSLRDTQTLSANTVDGMLELKAVWRNESISMNASGITRFAVGDPSSVPIRFKGFQTEAPILAGFSVGFEYPLSRRNINFGQVIHFSVEGYGLDTAVLFAESFMWRLLVYKYETIYLYSRARFRFQLGVNIGSDGALPYFEISFPFFD